MPLRNFSLPNFPPGHRFVKTPQLSAHGEEAGGRWSWPSTPQAIFALCPFCKKTTSSSSAGSSSGPTPSAGAPPPLLCQLQRLYVVVPPAEAKLVSCTLTLRPRVQYVEVSAGSSAHTAGVLGGGKRSLPKSKMFLFEPSSKQELQLPPDSFTCLKIPRVFSTDGAPHVQTRLNSPYICTLLPGAVIASCSTTATGKK